MIVIGYFIMGLILSRLNNINGKNFGFIESIEKGLYYVRKSFINSIKYSLIGGRGTVYWWFNFIGKLPIPDWIYIIFGKILAPVIVSLAFFFRSFVSFWDGIRGFFGHLRMEKYKDKLREEQQTGGVGAVREGVNKGYNLAKQNMKYVAKSAYDSGWTFNSKNFETGWTGFALTFLPFIGMSIIFSLFMTFINGLFFFFSYHFIPLTYPKIILNIISCNIHKFGFLFGIGVIAFCWKLINDGQGPLPKEVVIAMTITFVFLVFYNLFTKK